MTLFSVLQGYIGLFLEEDGASWLRDIMKNYAAEAKKIGIYIRVPWASSFFLIIITVKLGLQLIILPSIEHFCAHSLSHSLSLSLPLSLPPSLPPSVPPSAGVVVKPHEKQLHLTMSHQYNPEHHMMLEEMARAKVDPQAPAKWELRLYSRDQRQASAEVS